MDPNARLPPISPGTSDPPSYRLPSISNLVNVAPEPFEPPRQLPEQSLPRLPSLSQQRHVKQHAELLPNPVPVAHHNPALAVPGAELPYVPPASPHDRSRPGPRDFGPPSVLQCSPAQPWPLPPLRHPTTATYAGPSTHHSSALPSHPSERTPTWSRNAYGPRSARPSYPPHQNEPPISPSRPSVDGPDGPSQNLPSFASTFGQPSAQPAARFSEFRHDGPPTSPTRSREFERSRPAAPYPPDSRCELPIPQTDADSPANTVGTHALPIHRIPSSSYTSQPTIQFGLPQEYEFRPFELSTFPREPLPPRTQQGRDPTFHQQSHPAHPTPGTQDWPKPAAQPYRPPSPTGSLPVSQPRSATTVASNHTQGYPVGDWRADCGGSRGPAMSNSLSNSRSSVPASSSRSIRAPTTLPTQLGPRPVPSHPYPYDAPLPLGLEPPVLNSVSPQRPSRGRGARGRQQGSRGVRSDLASDATRVSSQSRKRLRRNQEMTFDPTAIAQPSPMITITPVQPLQPQSGDGGVPGGTPHGLLTVRTIPPRPKRLILQTGPEDLPRVQALLTQDTQAAAVRNRHMKKVRPGTSFRLISVARLADHMDTFPF
jgi:hypothetical protein